jgi:uncharacterized protein YacL
MAHMFGITPIRGLFIVVVVYVATLIPPIYGYLAINLALGLALALGTIALEARLRSAALTELAGGLIGFIVALTIARTISTALFWANTANPLVQFMHTLIIVVLPYLGLMIGIRNGVWLEPSRIAALFRDARPQKRYRILDTSVIIDGRIADIVETGFLDGALVVPQFVLKELQAVADSADPLKRNRGRRGLDILHRIRKMSGVEVIICDTDFPNVKEVDLKLIELARTMMGRIVTNDFNLNKVAQLRGVDVLNINELANALRPVVLPGELMNVFVLKEGKEYNQGVSYLDDGTMVVIDNARNRIGKNLDIVVTSVLQTTAGRMIFGRHAEPGTVHPGPGLPSEPSGLRDAQESRPAAGPGGRPAAQA